MYNLHSIKSAPPSSQTFFEHIPQNTAQIWDITKAPFNLQQPEMPDVSPTLNEDFPLLHSKLKTATLKGYCKLCQALYNPSQVGDTKAVVWEKPDPWPVFSRRWRLPQTRLKGNLKETACLASQDIGSRIRQPGFTTPICHMLAA